MGINERKEREKEQRRQDIIDAAEKVIFSKGLQQATMDEVAEAAELSKGTLYLYFKSKEELYLAISKRGMRIMREMFEKAVRSKKNGLEKSFDIGKAYFKFSEKYPNYYYAINHFEIFESQYDDTNEIVCLCKQEGHESLDIFINVLKEGIQDGSIRPDLKAEQAATIIWAQTSGVIQMVATKGPHLEKFHSVPMREMVEGSFQLLRCALENKPN